ncbi:WD domain, G-beta repeat protein [Ancylostoma caninum]|uniref:methylated diphthine methylhydrolase n=1 Tax=Ancylostoma caninum TaxID=29170 RepID=A0A368FU44_ANCCA|nr:WD domain, G-beta repeat protein [Ancylostoma caninum]
MSSSIKLPQRPAFARSTSSIVLVSTYQLEGPDSRVGSLYLLSHNLQIVQCIKAPAGVFRLEFLKPDVIIAAVTDGSLFTTTLDASPSTESIPVAEDILLDVSSPSPSSNVACTDKNGCAHIVDIGTGTVVASWKAHSLPYTGTGCEVWTCSLNDTLLCTGGEDATLKVWDVRTESTVQRMTEFTAGVTFSSWRKEHIILTGSYDQHIRLFDMRKSKEPLKINETSGGVWHIEDCHHSGKQCHIAACMYGGWTLLDENFDTIKEEEKAGQELLYGVTMASENLLVYTTFNDYKVTAVTV